MMWIDLTAIILVVAVLVMTYSSGRNAGRCEAKMDIILGRNAQAGSQGENSDLNKGGG